MQVMAQHDPTIKRVIENISQKPLEKAVCTKYIQMVTKYHKTEKKRKWTEEDDEFTDEEDEVIKTGLSCVQMNSCVQSVSFKYIPAWVSELISWKEARCRQTKAHIRPVQSWVKRQ